MITLNSLKNTHRKTAKVQRVGRGPGSKRGKTCGRGVKGDKSRSGYKRRVGHEGGQLPLYRKLPTRGFSNGRFQREGVSVNLCLIEALYNDGETVNGETLCQKGLAPKVIDGKIRILGVGELKKKVKIQAHGYTQSAKEKLEKNKISFEVLPFRGVIA